ncbi:MAG: POT family MFS transporter [Bdellovibrionota bacterium]
MANTANPNKYPPQIKYIVSNEAAERFSYYGMRTILTVFMIKFLMIPEADAVSTYHNFSAAVYLLPLLGAYLSDRWWGKYKTIMRLSVVYCLGHLVLALFESKTGLYWGLGLIALGSGGIKPCVSAHVGDQFKAGQEALLAKIFNLFYWMINFGAFFSTLLTPWTLEHYGPQLAFGIPGILMFIATIIFWMGRKHYIHVPPSGPNPHGFLKIVFAGVTGLFSGSSYSVAAKKKHPAKEVEASINIMKLILIYFWVSVFWALFDQTGSTWIIQAEKMIPSVAGIPVLPSQMQAINPILVLTLIPVFTFFIYPALEKIGIKMTPLRRMSFGMFSGALAFAAVSVVQGWIEGGQQLSIGWQALPYFIITMAEIKVSITGLEFAYTQAPRSMKSTIMSIWLLTTFFGNMLTSVLTKIKFSETASATYFWQFTGIMFAVSIIFSIFSIFYKEQNYMENDKTLKDVLIEP